MLFGLRMNVSEDNTIKDFLSCIATAIRCFSDLRSRFDRQWQSKWTSPTVDFSNLSHNFSKVDYPTIRTY
jgi:hypothetical protein